MTLKTDLSKFNNSWYYAGNKIKVIGWFLVSSVTINSYFPIPMFIKKRILTLFGARIGQNFVIKPKVNIKYPWFLEIGNNVWVGEDVWIDNFTTVKLYDNTCVSQGALLLTGNHNYKKTTFDQIIGEIHIEEGAWVGAKSIVCPGVRLHSHAVLAVGSVATQNLTAYSIYQGNPAVKVRERSILI